MIARLTIARGDPRACVKKEDVGRSPVVRRVLEQTHLITCHVHGTVDTALIIVQDVPYTMGMRPIVKEQATAGGIKIQLVKSLRRHG